MLFNWGFGPDIRRTPAVLLRAAPGTTAWVQSSTSIWHAGRIRRCVKLGANFDAGARPFVQVADRVDIEPDGFFERARASRNMPCGAGRILQKLGALHVSTAGDSAGGLAFRRTSGSRSKSSRQFTGSPAFERNLSAFSCSFSTTAATMSARPFSSSLLSSICVASRPAIPGAVSELPLLVGRRCAGLVGRGLRNFSSSLVSEWVGVPVVAGSLAAAIDRHEVEQGRWLAQRLSFPS